MDALQKPRPRGAFFIAEDRRVGYFVGMRIICVIVCLGVGPCAFAQCDQWSRGFAPAPGGLGMNGGVNDLVEWGGALYATGSFFDAGGVRANYLAKWTGSGWARVGSGEAFNGGGMDLTGYALAVYGNRLVVGGFFNSAGDVPAQQIAIWDGHAFAPLGTGITGGFRRVSCLAVVGGDLYAGGAFMTAGGVPAANIARWNGSEWSPLGVGTNGEVFAIASYQGSLVVGGRFNAAGGVSRRGIASWNGTTWTDFAGGQAGSLGAVYCLLAEGNDLYVGGNFASLGSAVVNDIATWNGSSWNTMHSGVTGVGVNALMRFDGTLVVAGQFYRAGAVDVQNIATWSPTDGYRPLAEGLNLNVETLIVYGESGQRPSLWAGGGFFNLGDNVTPSSNIGRWGAACAAEMTCDGFLDIFDYEEFVRAFEAGEPKADVAYDGFVDAFDYDRYVELFEFGCR